MLLKLASRLPRPVKNVLKKVASPLHVRLLASRRRKVAMSYYSRQLDFIRRWSLMQTEDSNFYYRLTPANRQHLSWLISHLSGVPAAQVTGYFDELENDARLREHITKSLKGSGYGRDIQVEYGRRLGWYAFVRVLRPAVVIETGIDHGVGSCVLASALLRNKAEGHPGRYFGTEIRPEAGQLFCEEYASAGEILYGDSITSLQALPHKVDLFINDSDHSAEYEYREYQVIKDKLSEGGVILGDNAHVTESLSDFSRETGRQFLFFSEKPLDHWYPGAGIGISFTSASGLTAAAGSLPKAA